MDEYKSFDSDSAIDLPADYSDVSPQLADDFAIICTQATVGWQFQSPSCSSTVKDDGISLENVSFKAQGGQILAIVGQVGSGKVSCILKSRIFLKSIRSSKRRRWLLFSSYFRVYC